jgi:hypothetical protein
MATKLYYNPFVPAFSNIGVPIAEAKLYFYLTGTSTLAPVWSNAASTVALPNPISANLAGKYPAIYLDAAVTYRIVQLDKNNSPIGDAVDPYIPGQVYVGPAGPTGPANNTYTTSALLKASAVSNVSAIYGGSLWSSALISAQPAWKQSAITTDNAGDGIMYVKSTSNVLYYWERQVEYVTPAMFGAVGDLTTDDTVAIQKFFTYCADYHVKGMQPNRSYRITSQIILTASDAYQRAGIKILSANKSTVVGQIKPTLSYFWDGPNFGEPFKFNNIRDSEFELGLIAPYGTKSIGVAVDIDGSYSTNNRFSFVTSAFGGLIYYACRLANTSTLGGCDLMHFDTCTFRDATLAGFLLVDPIGQSKGNRFTRCSFQYNRVGYEQQNGSSIMEAPNFSSSTEVDFKLTAGDSLHVTSLQSEGSAKFLHTGTGSSSLLPVVFVGGRLARGGVPLSGGRPEVDFNMPGPVTFIGFDFALGVQWTGWRANFSNGGDSALSPRVSFIGCQFPNTVPILDKSKASITMVNCTGISDAAGHSVWLPDMHTDAYDMTVGGSIVAPRTQTLVAGAVGLDASLCGDFITQANAGSTTLAAITGGVRGQVITIAGGSNTNPTVLNTGAVFKLKTASITLNLYTVVTLKTYDGSVWVQL